MKLGFTGTRDGMTDVQREAVAEFLRKEAPTVVHHGDCLGADSQFHDSALLLPQPPRIESHPCNKAQWRANRKADVIHPIKVAKDRNRDIARACDLLIAAPKAPQSKTRYSGTWQTVRLALSFEKRVIVIWPDGSVQSWGKQ